MGRVIGIDLGTTNSVAAYWSKKRPKIIKNQQDGDLTPSVVTIEQGRRIVGQDARDRRLSGSRNVIYSVKRFIGLDFDDPNVQATFSHARLSYEVRKAKNGEVEIKLGDGWYGAIEISAMILEQLKKDAELVLGDEVSHAVITVPAYFGQRQKNATREAGKLAGLNVLRIINEPTAAALAFGVVENSSEPQQILVFDLGGGTFDISILMIAGGNFSVLHVDGDRFLGGDNFDERLIDELLHVLERQSGDDFSNDLVAMSRLRGIAETAKKRLSTETETRVVQPAITQTKSGQPVNLDYVLTRARFDELTRDLVRRALDITQQALRNANLTIQDIDRVLLVGGSTRLPTIRAELHRLFGDNIEIDVDPMQCVGLGAAVQTSLPIEWLCPKCKTVNDGNSETCRNCGQLPEGQENQPHLVCDTCGKTNRQGRSNCWSCGTTLGATIGDNEDVHITDITSHFVGVETDDGREQLKVCIEKGTPYPTDAPYRLELFTSRLGQDYYRLPVYETERQQVKRDEWEHIGVVFNSRLPPGLPKNTPIVVEMRIDGNGRLDVASYVKNLRDDTVVQESFQFCGASAGDKPKSDVLALLELHLFLLDRISELPMLKKYLDERQISQAKVLLTEGQGLAAVYDEVRAKHFNQRAGEFVRGLPAPTVDVFLARYVSEHPQTGPMDKSQVDQIIMRMERAAGRGDFGEANQHLTQLRAKTGELFEHLPSDLLRSMQA